MEEKYGVTEEKYSEKVSGNSRNLLIEWDAIKPLSDYFKREVKVKFEVEGLTDVEVEIDGKRKKMNKGKLKVEIKGLLIRDPDSKWDKSPFYAFIREIYNKYVIPGRIETMEILLRSDVTKFKEELKNFLELSGRR